MAATQGRLVSLRWRRIIAIGVTALCGTALYAVLQTISHSLGDTAMASGWTLLASTAGLYGLGWRKKQLQRRLGPVAAWLQIHTYLGLFALLVFVLHAGWPIGGRFEQALAAMFLFISCSGGILLWYSRRVPRLLAAVKRDLRMEDIAQIQKALAERAHEVALRCAATDAGAPLTEYYQHRLLRFLVSPRSWLYRCVPNGVKRRQLLRELEDLDRYLDAAALAERRALSEIVIAKDDTDFHAAMQNRLRALMTAHVALTWSLWLMIAVHIVLVLRFSGAMV